MITTTLPFCRAVGWRRIEQEEAFVGRTAEVGDELGSRIVAARVARDLVRMCFLVERRYAPYSKWLGSALAQLDAAGEVGPPLERALAAATFKEREAGLVTASEAIARRFLRLGAVDTTAEPIARLFHERPYRVQMAERFVHACWRAIEGPWLRSLPVVGGVDQYLDSTVALDPATARRTSPILDAY